MKKIYPAVLLILSVILALINVKNSTFQKAAQELVHIKQTSSYFSSLIKHPRAEHEAYSIPFQSGSYRNYRLQNALDFFSLSEQGLYNFGSRYTITYKSQNSLSYKEYLFHIYPFQDFW